MLNVYNHWDKLKTCIVGKSYSPKFYDFVSDTNIRNKLRIVAEQTEEDLDNLSKQLQKFGVQVIRPVVTDNYKDVLYGNKLLPAPISPRDYTAVIDNKVFMPSPHNRGLYNKLRGTDWPLMPPTCNTIDGFAIEDLYNHDHSWLKDVQDFVEKQGNEIVYDMDIDSAMVHRVGDTLYVGNWSPGDTWVVEKLVELFPSKRIQLIETHGHLDGCICIVSPNLVITRPNMDITFLDKEVYTININNLRITKPGTWWLPSELTSAKFEDYISTYLQHWIGNIQETYVGVNMLMVDPSNVFCSNEDEDLFNALERHNITPHVVPFRHEWFWDNGLHCVTSDLDRC